MSYRLIVIAFLFFSAQCYCQNIYKGRLVSGLTGKPIRSGLIDLNGKLLSDTDTLGYFAIELDSATNITLGFSTTEVGNFSIANLHFKKNETLLITFEPECTYSSQKDIARDSIKLLMSFGAFSPLLTKKDHAFEKKYNLLYYGYGDCSGGIVTDCIEVYNKAISKYLDKKYGRKWRKEVNKGVLGL
jgi:hypothetical protein